MPPPAPYDPGAEARRREAEFRALLEEPNVDLAELRRAAWKGIPSGCRAQAWMILMGHAPTCRARRAEVLERKQAEYVALVRQHYVPARLAGDPVYKQVRAGGRAGLTGGCV